MLPDDDLATALLNHGNRKLTGRAKPDSVWPWYDFAVMSAKAGRHDKALEYLSHQHNQQNSPRSSPARDARSGKTLTTE